MLFLLGCPSKDEDTLIIDSTPSETDTTEETGSLATASTGDTGLCPPVAVTPVDDPPCDSLATGAAPRGTYAITDVSVESTQGEHPGTQFGYTLAISGAHVLVSQTLPSYTTAQPPTIYALGLPTLGIEGSWQSDEIDYDFMGSSLAIRDVDNDGTNEVAIGRMGAPDTVGSVHIVRGLPDGVLSLPDVTSFTFYGPEFSYLGADVDFAAVGPDPCAVELIAGGGGPGYGESEGGIWAIDPNGLGSVDWSEAPRSIRGPSPFGVDFAVIDLDGDGWSDLVARDAESAALFRGPWLSDLRSSDYTTSWRDEGEGDIGYVMENAGDLDGDGYRDLALAGPQHSEPEYHTGRAYIVTGGAIPPGDTLADDLATQVRGSAPEERMGSAFGPGDIDGDGQGDLVIGASGSYSPTLAAGAALVLFGPVCPSIYTAGEADLVITGEGGGDYFGNALAIADADLDGREDILVSAMRSTEERPETLYLVTAASLGL